MIVPQPRGKGLGRRELRGEILKFCAGVGRQSKEGRMLRNTMEKRSEDQIIQGASKSNCEHFVKGIGRH